jgi:hypothetical protein
MSDVGGVWNVEHGCEAACCANGDGCVARECAIVETWVPVKQATLYGPNIANSVLGCSMSDVGGVWNVEHGCEAACCANGDGDWLCVAQERAVEDGVPVVLRDRVGV